MPDLPAEPFNPLDKRNLAASIALALEQAPVHALPPKSFKAAGLYFLYYSGSFADYLPLVNFNQGKFHWPIYIGKGMPPGVRKGAVDESKKDKSTWGIYDRLYNHSKSITHVTNLNQEDFHCRWLSMDEAFIHLGEILLITKYQPLWNVAVEGFGNKVVGSGRAGAKKSTWDTFHPGRGGAAGGVGNLTTDTIRLNIAAHFAATLPPQV